MASNITKNWDYGQINLATAGIIYEICKIRGGESATIKALSGNSGQIYLGSDKLVSSSKGYQLDASETISLTLPSSFGIDNEIIIYAVGTSNGDDVCYIKLIDDVPETSGA